jgi:uncharacterized membrane protein
MNPRIANLRRSKSAHAREESQHGQNGNHGHSGSHGSSSHEINVGDIERQFSMIGGTALAICGLLRGSMSGLSLAAIGGALIWRGHTGHCEMYHMLGHNTAEGSDQQHHGEQHEGHQQTAAEHA